MFEKTVTIRERDTDRYGRKVADDSCVVRRECGDRVDVVRFDRLAKF